MVASRENEPGGANNRTTTERKSDREMVITRMFDAPPRLVFEAWTTPELFRQWWVPKSSGATLLSCEQDVRVGGGYRLEFAIPGRRRPWRSSADTSKSCRMPASSGPTRKARTAPLRP
ncbi:protein of unknown function (plasmid) [Caballeronia sp. S22]